MENQYLVWAIVAIGIFIIAAIDRYLCSGKLHVYNTAKIAFTICGGWWSAMSGAASIPFAFFALFSDASHPVQQKLNFAIVAIAALWVLAFGLVLKNIPKFKLACSKDIDLCATPKVAHDARYFRMRVSTQSMMGIEQCSGNLEKIEKDGIVIYEGDATVLPFAKAEDADSLSKLIKPDTNHWLDILVVTVTHYTEYQLRVFTANAASGYVLPELKDTVYFRTKPPSPANDINGNYIFEKKGDYILYVNVSGKGVPTAKAQLKFTWTGKANTSIIERIK